MTKPQLTTDWTSWHFPRWREWLGHLVGKPAVGLEIGTFEGRSAQFFLDEILTNKASRLICVDPWAYSEEREIIPTGSDPNADQFDMAAVRRRAMRNLAPYADRVVIHGVSSRVAIPLLVDPYLDFAYVDGSHLACRALEDLVLIWPKIRPGGIVICDDYDWTANVPPPPGWTNDLLRPRLGIDAWLQVYHGQYDQVNIRGGQVMIRKP